MTGYLQATALAITLMILGAFPVAACAAGLKDGTKTGTDTVLPRDALKGIPEETTQALIVTNDNPASFSARLHVARREGGLWRTAMPPIEAVIGQKGFAPEGEKKEGDGRTPSGVYGLTRAFGYTGELSTRMAYAVVTEDDIWVDDPASPDYNKWVKRGSTKALSFEEMKRGDHLYKYAIIVEYNTRPVVSGRGSAIFFHIWRGPGQPTTGCIAMEEGDLKKILEWLDPQSSPVAVLGTYGAP